jgi:hypothetical protein
MSNRGLKLPKQKKPQGKAERTKRRISPVAAILGSATLIGGFAALLTLVPRVTVVVSDPVNPTDPFSASATVTNTGLIPLDSVTPEVSINFIQTKGVPAVPDDEESHYGPRIHRNVWRGQDLGLDDKFTIALNDLYRNVPPAELQAADIMIWVEYEIPVVHWKRDKGFPLVAHRQTNGKFYWYSKTVK